jgi:hypothetical protein
MVENPYRTDFVEACFLPTKTGISALCINLRQVKDSKFGSLLLLFSLRIFILYRDSVTLKINNQHTLPPKVS